MAASIARLTLILAATFATSVALASDSTYDKALNAPPGGQLTFDSDVGSVSVVGGDTREVVVHADLEGSESFLRRLHISAEQTASGVMVSARLDNGWLDWFDWFDFGSVDVRFAVQVPRDYPVDIRTSGGGLAMRDLNASVQARTSGGGIVLQNVAGRVYGHTSGGGIRAERLGGPAELSTSGGPIAVVDSTGDLDLHTSGGGIRIQDDDGKVDAHTSGGGIRAELRSNRGVSLGTSGGSITLLLPQDAHGSIEAHTSGGGISCDFPITTTDLSGGDRVQGTIGGGGPPITLHTSGGSIRIEREN
jgi:Toastrack DUF4097